MTCSVCNYDKDAPVEATYDIRLARCTLDSQNRLGSNNRGRSRYRGIRNKYTSLLAATGVPKATKKRRVFITRQYGYKKRAYDFGNLVGGCKPLLDAMKLNGLIVDDRPTMLQEFYFQEKSPDKNDHILIRIEEGKFE